MRCRVAHARGASLPDKEKILTVQKKALFLLRYQDTISIVFFHQQQANCPLKKIKRIMNISHREKVGNPEENQVQSRILPPEMSKRVALGQLWS